MTLVERAAGALAGLLGPSRDDLSFGDRTFGVRTHELGLLHLPTGALVACDPLVSDGAAPFTRAVPAGSHPVRALVVEYADNGDQRVAAALVGFGSAPAVSWEAALSRDDGVPLGDDDFVGYPVDSGTGCFASPEAVQRLADVVSAHYAATPEQDDPLSAELAKTYVNTWDWTSFDVGDGLNVVAFASGTGDGLYPTTFGIAADGTPVLAVTDFFVFDATAV